MNPAHLKLRWDYEPVTKGVQAYARSVCAFVFLFILLQSYQAVVAFIQYTLVRNYNELQPWSSRKSLRAKKLQNSRKTDFWKMGQCG